MKRDVAGFLRPIAAYMRNLNTSDAFIVVVLVSLVTVALIGDLLAPHPPGSQDLANRLRPPVWSPEGSWSHLLGTDQLGRDLFSRLIAGAQTTLIIAGVAAVIELSIGSIIGVVAGFVGGRVESVLMNWTDIQMSFPSLLIFFTIVLAVGRSLPVLIIALAINGWMIFARVSRTAVRSLRNEEFVEAAIAAGAKRVSVVRRHILPHIRFQLAALFLLEVARLILAESGASFLGLGVQPPEVSWGLILGASRDYIPVAYHLAFFPGLAIVVGVLSLSVLSRRISREIGQRDLGI